jgi:excisionase family DNA binding protein
MVLDVSQQFEFPNQEQPVTRPTKVLTVVEIADYLRVHPSTIYRLLRKGSLPAFKVGADWRFSLESIDQWRLQQPSPAPIPRGPRTAPARGRPRTRHRKSTAN